MAPLNYMLEGELKEQVRSFLAKNNVVYTDVVDIELFNDPTFEITGPGMEATAEDGFVVSQEDEPGIVATVEVGWSWWVRAQLHAANLVGQRNLRAMMDIYAWMGVSVPADLDSAILGELRPFTLPPKPLLERLGLRRPGRDELMNRLMQAQVLQNGGLYDNFCIVSTPRLIEDFERAIDAAGILGTDANQLYESVDDQDDKQVAECTLLLFHRFLTAAQSANHLVWWMK